MQANMVSDSLPDAKKRTAYDFAPPAAYDADHPLGRSSMNALGEKTVSKVSYCSLPALIFFSLFCFHHTLHN
jgi:hypothetical protein